MRIDDNSTVHLLLFFAAMMAFVSAPIWFVGTFVSQDGTSHLYNAYLIGEILKGNQSIQTFAALNPNAIPNLTGHWLLAAVLPVLGPTLTTKLAVTVLLGLFVGSIGWLRYQTGGRDGISVCLLLATALALNWPWLLGFYNFILALSALSFTLGLWWKWRDSISVPRFIALFALLLLTFFSHLVSFGLLAVTLAFLSIWELRSGTTRSTIMTLGVLALTTPFVLNFLALGLTDGGFHPTWRNLDDTLGISTIISQLSSADPFALMTRRSVPFIEGDSLLLVVFAPVCWIGIALLLLVLGTFKSNDTAYHQRKYAGWIGLTVLFMLIALVGPDDFGSVHGGFLRERILIVSLICAIPFLKLKPGSIFTKAATIALTFVIIFQTLVIWEYALRYEDTAKNFLAAKDQVRSDENIGSVVFVEDEGRFRSIPAANLSPIIGIGKNGTVWDNYELGYYLFPVIARNAEQQTFVAEFRAVSTYNLDDPKENLRGKLKRLETLLETENHRFSILLVWNERAEFSPIRVRWFENKPYFVSGDLKLYRHR